MLSTPVRRSYAPLVLLVASTTLAAGPQPPFPELPAPKPEEILQQHADEVMALNDKERVLADQWRKQLDDLDCFVQGCSFAPPGGGRLSFTPAAGEGTWGHGAGRWTIEEPPPKGSTWYVERRCLLVRLPSEGAVDYVPLLTVTPAHAGFHNTSVTWRVSPLGLRWIQGTLAFAQGNLGSECAQPKRPTRRMIRERLADEERRPWARRPAAARRADEALIASPPSTPAFTMSEVYVADRIDKRASEKVLRRVETMARKCYEALQDRTPALEGKVTLAWTVHEYGGVTDLRVAGLEHPEGIDARPLVMCVRGSVEGLRFPTPSGGPVEMSQTYTFSNEALLWWAEIP